MTVVTAVWCVSNSCIQQMLPPSKSDFRKPMCRLWFTACCTSRRKNTGPHLECNQNHGMVGCNLAPAHSWLLPGPAAGALNFAPRYPKRGASIAGVRGPDERGLWFLLVHVEAHIYTLLKSTYSVLSYWQVGTKLWKCTFHYWKRLDQLLQSSKK